MNQRNDTVNNEHVEGELTLFLEGELSEEQRCHVEEHLASCEHCARALRELKRLPQILLEFGEIEQAETMFDEIKSRMERNSWHRFFTLQLAWKIGLQFSFAVLIVCLTLFINGHLERQDNVDLSSPKFINLYLREHQKRIQTATLREPPPMAHIPVQPEDLVYSEFLSLFPDFVQIQRQLVLARGGMARQNLPTTPTIPAEETLTLGEAQKAVPFHVIAPPYLHPGYILDGICKVKERNSLHLVYTNGIDTLSLFEQALQGQKRLNAKELREYAIYRSQKDSHATILAWRDDAIAFALVGVAEMRQLMGIVESIQSHSLKITNENL